MHPTIAGIQNMFEFVGSLGQWIRRHLAQPTTVNVTGKGEMRIVVELSLSPQLESVIRDVLAGEDRQEDPAAFWAHATRELIRGHEQKFSTLQEIGVSDMTLGMEAMTQRMDSVPEEIERVMVRYVERYVLADTDNQASARELPASSLSEVLLSEALETVVRNANKDDAASLTRQLGGPRVRPSRRWGEHRQNTQPPS